MEWLNILIVEDETPLAEMHAEFGRDADLLIVVNSQIPTNDLIVHFL